MSDENYLEFDVITILKESFEVFKKLFPIYLLLYLGWLILLSVLTIAFGMESEEDQSLVGTIIWSALIFALTTFFTGTITAATWSYINNQPSHITNGLRRCADVILPLLGASILSAVFVIGGLILLIVPGVMIGMALILVMPIVVIENPGIVNSLKRSHELTDGHKMTIFIMVLVLAIPVIFIGAIGVAIDPQIGELIKPLIQGLVTIFYTIMYVVIYKRLSAQEIK